MTNSQRKVSEAELDDLSKNPQVMVFPPLSNRQKGNEETKIYDIGDIFKMQDDFNQQIESFFAYLAESMNVSKVFEISKHEEENQDKFSELVNNTCYMIEYSSEFYAFVQKHSKNLGLPEVPTPYREWLEKLSKIKNTMQEIYEKNKFLLGIAVAVSKSYEKGSSGFGEETIDQNFKEIVQAKMKISVECVTILNFWDDLIRRGITISKQIENHSSSTISTSLSDDIEEKNEVVIPLLNLPKNSYGDISPLSPSMNNTYQKLSQALNDELNKKNSEIENLKKLNRVLNEKYVNALTVVEDQEQEIKKKKEENEELEKKSKELQQQLEEKNKFVPANDQNFNKLNDSFDTSNLLRSFSSSRLSEFKRSIQISQKPQNPQDSEVKSMNSEIRSFLNSFETSNGEKTISLMKNSLEVLKNRLVMFLKDGNLMNIHNSFENLRSLVSSTDKLFSVVVEGIQNTIAVLQEGNNQKKSGEIKVESINQQIQERDSTISAYRTKYELLKKDFEQKKLLVDKMLFENNFKMQEKGYIATKKPDAGDKVLFYRSDMATDIFELICSEKSKYFLHPDAVESVKRDKKFEYPQITIIIMNVICLEEMPENNEFQIPDAKGKFFVLASVSGL